MCFGGGGSDNDSGNDNDKDNSGSGNSFAEALANAFTPNDGASYVDGNLVDDRTGQSIEAGGTTFSGNVISGMANDTSNDGGPLPSSFTNSLPAMVENPNKNSYNETQTDDKWGYTRADGSVVSAAQDMIDGGGKNFGGEVFGASGGVNADLDGDGYVTAAEAAASGNLSGNMISGISNASGATPLGSGLEPTGVAGALYNYSIPGMLYQGAKNMTDNFGYVGRPESSLNSDIDSVVGGLSGQDAINAAVNYAVQDTSVGYPTSIDDVNISTAAFEGNRDENERTGVYGTRGTFEDYNRYSRGGGGYKFMPAYMRRYMTGENFDVTAKQITLADGSIAYQRPDGSILSPEQFQNTAEYKNALTVEGPDERYLQGYSQTGPDGLPIYFDAEGNPVDSLG
jgi:hypothetical protein